MSSARVRLPVVATRTTPERNPRGQGELLRERLVDAALAMIDEGTDPAELSIRSVTKRAGVSPTAFYLHFEHRDALLAAMIDRCFTEFRDAVRAGVGDAPTPAEQLTRAGLAYVDFARRRPARYAMNFQFMRQPDDQPPEKPSAADDSFNDLVTRVADYLPEDDPRRAEAEVLARGIWSGLHGYVTLSRARAGMGWPAEEDFVRRLVLAWLGPPAAGAG